jgi:hypothetical protein
MQAFLFDEETWEVKYLVVDLSNGLSNLAVVIAVIAIEQPNQVSQKFPIQLTKEQTRNSPILERRTLGSQRTQGVLNQTYSLFQYWALSGYSTVSLPSSSLWGTGNLLPSHQGESGITFRNSEVLIGSHVKAVDGALGVIEDIVVDDASWSIRYMVANPKKWLLGRKFWITPTWIHTIDWEAQHMFLKISKEQLKNTPDYKSSEAE